MIEKALSVLQRYFGYTQFRDGQQKVIDSLLRGTDTLAIMPTGAGKSLAYQIPALLFQGTTLANFLDERPSGCSIAIWGSGHFY